MFKFDGATYGQLGDALCKLETVEGAREFWHGYVEHLRRPDAKLMGRTAEEVVASNIGYLMGYYGPEERQRVYGLFSEFKVSHPVFGTYEPMPDEALRKGMEIGAGLRGS